MSVGDLGSPRSAGPVTVRRFRPRAPAIPPKPIQVTVKPDGTLDVPFEPGTVVEVSLPKPAGGRVAKPPERLRGTVLKYDDPLEPACDPDEWEANR